MVDTILTMYKATACLKTYSDQGIQFNALLIHESNDSLFLPGLSEVKILRRIIGEAEETYSNFQESQIQSDS